MSENLLQTLQQLVEDVIAPDVRELKVWLASLEKLIEVRFDARIKGSMHKIKGLTLKTRSPTPSSGR